MSRVKTMQQQKKLTTNRKLNREASFELMTIVFLPNVFDCQTAFETFLGMFCFACLQCLDCVCQYLEYVQRTFSIKPLTHDWDFVHPSTLDLGSPRARTEEEVSISRIKLFMNTMNSTVIQADRE
jgi:hypothetical protein